MFSMTAYTNSLCTLLSWQSRVISFNLPFMKQTGLMESKSFFPLWDYWGGSVPERRSAGELLADVFWIALLFPQEEHKRFFPERDAQHLFDVRIQSPLYSCDEKFLKILLLLFGFVKNLDWSNTDETLKVRRGVWTLVLMPACNLTQIHPAVFISQHIKSNNGVAQRNNKSGL